MLHTRLAHRHNHHHLFPTFPSLPLLQVDPKETLDYVFKEISSLWQVQRCMRVKGFDLFPGHVLPNALPRDAPTLPTS